MISPLFCMTDPWVDDAINDVYHQIDKDDQDGHDQQPILHHRIITPENSVDQPLADTRPGENGFREYGPANQRTDLQANDRYHGNHGVAQRMHKDDAPWRQSFGPGGADIIFAHDFEHGRGVHPRDG